MAIPHPLSCDLHIRAGAAIVQEIRFDYTPGDPPVITAEALLARPTPVSFTAEEWIADDERILSFVERAFDLKRSLWSRDLEDDTEAKFDATNKRLVFEALAIPDEVFVRTVDHSIIEGVPTVTVQPYMASGPMTLNTLHVFLKAVESLIEMNNGGSTTRGL
jgi:hypothetical protein